jgi:hypothetical protein
MGKMQERGMAGMRKPFFHRGRAAGVVVCDKKDGERRGG